MSSNTGLTQSPGSELGRPLYPRTQYRAHITLDSSGTTLENPYSLQGGYDSIGSIPPVTNIMSVNSGTYRYFIINYIESFMYFSKNDIIELLVLFVVPEADFLLQIKTHFLRKVLCNHRWCLLILSTETVTEP